MALFGRKKEKPAEEASAEGATEEKKDEKAAAADKGKDGKPAEGKDDKKSEGDAPAEGAEGEAPPEGNKKKKLIIMIAGGVLALLLIGGGAAWFMGAFSGHKAETAEKSPEGSGEPAKTAYFDLPQILVNLNTGSKTTSFVKATVTLELADGKDTTAVQANLPRLIDSYNTFLREMKPSDLYGSAGMYRLREEMLLRANTILAPVKVKDVLFKELLVQ